MHQLALSYKKLGINVYGYDAKQSEYTKILSKNNIFVTDKFKPELLQVDLCVRTPAIKDDNPYIKALKQNNVKIIDRAQALNQFFPFFKCVIAVAGTHGKSTTASLIYEILRVANKKVSCHIGADVLFSRFSLGDEFLVVEACEYNKSFLSFYPTISVITNIEREHMDCYKSIFDLNSCFAVFTKRAPYRFAYLEKGTKFLSKLKNINFATKNDVLIQGVKPKIKGEHNKKNIMLAIKVAEHLKIDKSHIVTAINNFNGIPRRYEYIGKANDTKFYIDYAHHPTELKAFIDTFTKEEDNPLIVFQPHTYTRTKTFFNDFIEVLSNVKNLVIFKEYPAREKSQGADTAFDLYNAVKKLNKNVEYCKNEKKLYTKNINFSAVAFVGAGDINIVAKNFLDKLKSNKT